MGNKELERDANGNTSAYVYDLRNLLTRESHPLAAITGYKYDAMGDRIEVRDPEARTTTFAYDLRRRLLSETNDEGETTRYTYDGNSVLLQSDEQGQTIAKYDYGPDQLLSMQHAGEGRQFYLFDALGSVSNLTNTSGTVQARYQYDAFGNIREEAGSSYNRFTFTGHEKDEETGLYYFKARFYDPDTGRFINQDPYLGDINTPPSLHRYLYAYANPVVYIDLNGYCNATAEIFGAVDCEAEIQRARDIATGAVSVEQHRHESIEKAKTELPAIIAAPFVLGLSVEAAVIVGSVRTFGVAGLFTYDAQVAGIVLLEEAAGVTVGANMARQASRETIDRRAISVVESPSAPSVKITVMEPPGTKRNPNGQLNYASTEKFVSDPNKQGSASNLPEGYHFRIVNGKVVIARNPGRQEIPKLSQTDEGNLYSPVKFDSSHGNTAGNQTAYLYEKYDKDGNFLKHGVTQDPNTRYTEKELDGGELVVTDKGPRNNILRKERELVETDPGPHNKEPWAGSKKNKENE